jgi:hypothetical protein
VIRRPERDVDHSPLHNAEAQIVGAVPLLALYVFMAWTVKTIPLRLALPSPVKPVIAFHYIFGQIHYPCTKQCNYEYWIEF